MISVCKKHNFDLGDVHFPPCLISALHTHLPTHGTGFIHSNIKLIIETNRGCIGYFEYNLE